MLARIDALPTVARLSDQAETLMGSVDATPTGEQSHGCHLHRQRLQDSRFGHLLAFRVQGGSSRPMRDSCI